MAQEAGNRRLAYTGKTGDKEDAVMVRLAEPLLEVVEQPGAAAEAA